jgi:hypothetical protein
MLAAILLALKILAAFATLGGVVFFKDFREYVGRTLAFDLLFFTAILTLSSVLDLFGISAKDALSTIISLRVPSREPVQQPPSNDAANSAYPAGGPSLPPPPPPSGPVSGAVPPNDAPTSILQLANSKTCPFQDARNDEIRDRAWQLVEQERKKDAPDYAVAMSCFLKLRERKVCGGAWGLGAVWVFYMAKGLDQEENRKEACPYLQEDATSPDRTCPDIRARFMKIRSQCGTSRSR